MADERKAEQTEAEKLVESLEAEIKGEGGEESVEETGSPSVEKKAQKDAKGWTTILPKRFREGAKDHESLESYLEYLHEAREGGSSEPETEETWEESIKDLGADDHDKAILSAMREKGIGSETAKSIYWAIQMETEAIVAESAKASKKAVEDHFKRMRKAEDNYDAILKNGMRKISQTDQDTFLDAKGKGLFNHPAVLNMVYMLGKAETEDGPMATRSGGKKDGYDPYNPLRY